MKQIMGNIFKFLDWATKYHHHPQNLLYILHTFIYYKYIYICLLISVIYIYYLYNFLKFEIETTFKKTKQLLVKTTSWQSPSIRKMFAFFLLLYIWRVATLNIMIFLGKWPGVKFVQIGMSKKIEGMVNYIVTLSKWCLPTVCLLN